MTTIEETNELRRADNGLPAVVTFFVPGKPQTAGSKSGFVNPKTGGVIITESGDSASKRRKATWRGDLKDEARRAAGMEDAPAGATWAAADEPLEVRFVEVRKRSSAHLRTGAHAGEVKDWARELRPTSRPDALKVARAAEDALTGVLWPDDAQIVSERLDKAFADQVGLDPRMEGLVVAARRAGAYRGPTLRG